MIADLACRSKFDSRPPESANSPSGEIQPMTATILSAHRRTSPAGMNGGEVSKSGRNTVQRADGTVEELAGNDQREMQPGDVFIIETPGGSGFGAPRMLPYCFNQLVAKQ
jgi:N-methylhydantoinase B/oxoprolinase/acetone carboxylase alpha subunit